MKKVIAFVAVGIGGFLSGVFAMRCRMVQTFRKLINED